MENINGNAALNFTADPMMPQQPAVQPNPNAVANVAPTIDLPILTQKEEALSVVQENLVGLGKLKFDKIRMPAGGGLTFEVADESGNLVPVQEIRGVIIDHFPFKAWWEKSFEEKTDDDDKRPDCYSADGITGTGCPEKGIPAGQKCASCPKGAWGSDRRGGRGKDCSDKIRIHILREGEVFPVFIDLPATSHSNLKDYIKRLTNRLKHYYGVVTLVKLEKDKSATGIAYSKATFAKAADLTPAEKVAMKQYIDSMKDIIRRIDAETIAAEPGDGSPDLNNLDFGGATGEQVY
jgi:hypothetical protein